MKLEEQDDWFDLLSALEHFGEGDHKIIEAACRQARKVPELEKELQAAYDEMSKLQDQLEKHPGIRFQILAAGFRASQDLLAHYRIRSNRPPKDSVFDYIRKAKEIL